MVLAEAMAAEGLEILADGQNFYTANRIVATVDLLLSPGIDRNDGNGDPLTCPDCSRPTAWDDERGDYRHLVNPKRGCFLIQPENHVDDQTRHRRDHLTERLDDLERAPDSLPQAEPPDPPGIEP